MFAVRGPETQLIVETAVHGSETQLSALILYVLYFCNYVHARALTHIYYFDLKKTM